MDDEAKTRIEDRQSKVSETALSASTPYESRVGDKLAHYQLVEKLGAGGMGLVFKAHEAALRRNVAIKVLLREFVKDEQFLQRFQQEAQAVGGLNHPNIIQIYYTGEQNGIVFFAMEFVEGQSLESLLKGRGTISEKEALDFVGQAALGLRHAQQHGVIHRDVKPANLMLTHTGTIKVADFGLAKRVKQESSKIALTAPHTIMGSPHYISPEQARGLTVDHRSDIYSLGATLYHLLAGRSPFQGDDPIGIMIQQIESPLPPIYKFNPTITPGTMRILNKMLAKNPAERYQTYDELIDDLTATQQPKQFRRPFLLLTAAVVTSMLLTAGGFYFYARHSAQGFPPSTNPLGSANTKPATDATFVPLDISKACNYNIISSADFDATFYFDDITKLSWATTGFLQKDYPNTKGIPDNGLLAVPQQRSAEFRLWMPPAANAIILTDKNGRQPLPVSFIILPAQRRSFAKLAFLHASVLGGAEIAVTVQYADNSEETRTLSVLDWYPYNRDREMTPDQQVALKTPSTAGNDTREILSEIVTVDPTRILQSIKVSLQQRYPIRGGNPGDYAEKFTAAIFAVTALPTNPQPR